MWRAVAVALAAAAVAASSVDAPAAAGAAPAGDPYGGPPAPERAARGRWVYVAESDVDGASDAAWERAARERLEADLRDRVLAEHNATVHVGNGTGFHDEHHGGGHHAHVHKVLVFLFTALAAGALTLFLINHYVPSLPYTLALYIEGLILAIIIDRARTSLEPSLFYQTVRMWEHIGPHLLLYSFLPILLFGDSMSINTHLLAQKLIHCITLAVPGVMLGTTITGLVVWLLYPYDWSFCFCMMFGAIMSATDPVAVVALLKDLGASPAMTIVITGESLFNDGTAMVVFHLFFEIMSAYRKDGAVYTT
ncbi:potassium:proton antiporter [Aureococcus anophagefferens]|nr:potassium:proton antiporter [Aureococcus anophagefferens]